MKVLCYNMFSYAQKMPKLWWHFLFFWLQHNLATSGFRSFNDHNLGLCLTASKDVLVSFHLLWIIAFLHPNWAYLITDSIKSHQRSAGRNRFPLSFEVVCSFTDVLVSTETCNTAKKKEQKRAVWRRNSGSSNERKGKQVTYALMIRGCHVAMNI